MDFLLVLTPESRADGLRLARQLREFGKAVVVSAPDAGVEAQAVIRVDGRRVRVTDTKTQAERILDRDEFVAELRGRPRVVSWTH